MRWKSFWAVTAEEILKKEKKLDKRLLRVNGDDGN